MMQDKIVGLIITIVGLFALIAVYNIVFYKEAIHIDCLTQEISVEVTLPPPLCMACQPVCKAEINAHTSTGKSICKGKGGDSMANSARIECKTLSNYIYQNITVKYNITSPTGNITNAEQVVFIEP
jgi:hypothetical protein